MSDEIIVVKDDFCDLYYILKKQINSLQNTIKSSYDKDETISSKKLKSMYEMIKQVSATLREIGIVTNHL